MSTESEAEKPHAAYVTRLRSRLAAPEITVHEARDGVLDCFVATYHEGLAAGLHGVIGVDADADEVARIAAGLFRGRLRDHGASFDAPTVDALARVKAEVDEELHFEELPVEIRATHDRVCELLLAKADGALPHAGDRSAVPPSSRATENALTAPLPPLALPVAAPVAPTASASPLREAVASLLEEIASWTRGPRSMDEIATRLEKARRLVESARELEAH